MRQLRELIVDVPDFPKEGILFRDMSRLLRERFPETIQALDRLWTDDEWAQVSAVAGVESRGFILAAGLAAHRKKGKLPPPIIDIPYDLEYGTGVLEMQRGEGKVLLVDDVLATGGTLKASVELVHRAGYVVLGMGVLMDLNLAPGFSVNGLMPRTVIPL